MHPQQLEAVQQAATTASWVVMVGQPSLDGLATALESEAPVLLVLPDERAIQELEERWSRPWPEHVELAALLLAAESGEAAWFHYNDPRLNGLVGPDALMATFPNLRLVRAELRPARTLDDLLAGWAPAAGASQGLLVLCDTAGLSLLAGAGASLRRVERLVWWPNSVEPDAATTFAGLDAALQEQWLVATAPGIWQHDESLAFRDTVQAERDALLHEREQLVGTNSQSEARIHELEAQFAALSAEQEQLVGTNSQSEARIHELEAQFAALSAEQEQLVGTNSQSEARIHELEAQFAALSAEREQLVQERDALQGQTNTQQERLDRINIELNEILALIDQSNQEDPEPEHISETV